MFELVCGKYGLDPHELTATCGCVRTGAAVATDGTAQAASEEQVSMVPTAMMAAGTAASASTDIIDVEEELVELELG